MGIGKHSITLEPRRKKNIFSSYSTTMVATWDSEKNQSTLVPTEKIYIFFFGYSTTMMHGTFETKINITLPPPKNNYFRFWLQYHCGAHDLQKFQTALNPTEKKMVSSYNSRRQRMKTCTTKVHGTWKLLFGIMLMFNEKHEDAMLKAFG